MTHVLELQELLAENWTAKADEGAVEEGAPPAPAFNPAAPEYNVRQLYVECYT